MADYVVSPTGNDTTGDGSEGTPFATVDHVHDNVAVNGDRIIVRGELEQEVNLTRTFGSGAYLTVTQHDVDGGWISGAEWTLPATGAVPKTGPDGDVHLGPLVSLGGRYINWQVNVKKSKGRNISVSGQDIIVEKPSGSIYPFLASEWARNAGFNANDANNVTVRGLLVQYSGCFYQSIRNPNESSGGTNWPVAFNFVGTPNVLVEDCVSFHNWGEGISAGRGSDSVTIQDSIFIDNMSVNAYVNRCDTVYYLRNIIAATGTASGFNRSSGLALRNENNPNVTPPLRNIWVAHNLCIGNHNNLLIANNQEEGDTIEDIWVWHNTFVNARLGGNGSTFSNLRLAAGDRQNIYIDQNVFWQDSGPITNVGNLTGYAFARNFWGGGGSSPAAGVVSGSDISSLSMQSPNAGFAVIKDGNGSFLGTTLDLDNYRPTAAYSQPSKAGIGTTDLEGSTRTYWTLGGLEYGGTGGGDPDPDPPPPPTGSAAIAVARVACNTSTGDQDITLSGLDEAPNLFFFIVGNTTADDTASAGAALSHGWAATSSGQWAMGQSVEDAESPSNAARFSITDGCVILPKHLGNAIDGKAAYVSATSTAVTINWTTAPPSAFLLTVVAMVVPDAYVGSPLQSASEDGYVTVTPGFTPDVIHAAINGRPWPNETGNQSWHHSVGLASYDGTTIIQSAIITDAVDNISANESIGHIRNDYIGGFVNTSGNLVWAAEISDITATDFRLYTREGTPSPQSQVGIVAFSLGGVGSYVGLKQSPASAVTPPTPADHSWTGFGFSPKFVLAFNSLMSVIGSTVTTGDAGAYGVSAFLDGVEHSAAWAWEDSASGNSDTQTLFDDTAINLPQHDGTDGQLASLSSFDADGVTFTFTKALATARYSLVLAIQESTSISLDDFTGTPTSGNSPLEVDFEADVTVVGTTVDHYEWDFGDGNTDSTAGNTTSHTYTTTEVGGESWTVGVTAVAANSDESYLAKANYITATYVPPPPPSEPEEVNLHVFGGGGSHMKANGIPAAGGALG